MINWKKPLTEKQVFKATLILIVMIIITIVHGCCVERQKEKDIELKDQAQQIIIEEQVEKIVQAGRSINSLQLIINTQLAENDAMLERIDKLEWWLDACHPEIKVQ